MSTTTADAADIVERLRTTRLLSQRNQMVLQCEAAAEIEVLRAREAELRRSLASQIARADQQAEWAIHEAQTAAELQRKLDGGVGLLSHIADSDEASIREMAAMGIDLPDSSGAFAADIRVFLASIRKEQSQCQ